MRKIKTKIMVESIVTVDEDGLVQSIEFIYRDEHGARINKPQEKKGES